VGYTGHQSDIETGLTYMQARYYDPVVGRFMAVDPVAFNGGNPGQFGRYTYAYNNPLKYRDPDGEFAWAVVDGFVGAAINVGVQLATNGGEWSKINKSQVLVAAAAGAAGVHLAGAVSNLATQVGLTGVTKVAANIAGNAVTGGVIGVEANIANGVLDTIDGDGTDLSLDTMKESGKIGVMTGALGAVLGESVAAGATSSNLKALGESGTLNGLGKIVSDLAADLAGNSGDIIAEFRERE
jgi:RHS repeat-associated protein